MSDELIFTGKSVEEAVAEGLRVLGLTEAEVKVEVVARGSRGLFGIGSEPAQVRLVLRPSLSQPALSAEVAAERPLPAPSLETVAPAGTLAAVKPDEGREGEEISVPASLESSVADVVQGPVSTQAQAEQAKEIVAVTAEDEAVAQLAVELLSRLVQLMGFEATIAAEWRAPDADNEQSYLLLDLQGRELSPLIGRRGETLSNLQYLVRLMLNQRLHSWKNIVVDVEGYRQRRIDHLSQLALRLAEQVAQSGRPLALEPMAANERRIIHLTLRDHPDVSTESSGEGERRKVQILPKR
ncbi:MAG: Jag N-terminal domain-containing protein [Chloroflexi bacterium]|nr:Jag N-terminal domain-containing protein [Chloroflexota bacterium]